MEEMQQPVMPQGAPPQAAVSQGVDARTNAAQPMQPPAAAICPTCHQPVLPTYYFCPNCGTKLAGGKPLSTSLPTQLWIYFLSIIMPLLAFVVIKYWPGMKYLRSSDWTKKQIGIIALVLMVASTIVVTWWLIVWTEGLVQTMTGGLMGTGSLGL